MRGWRAAGAVLALGVILLAGCAGHGDGSRADRVVSGIPEDWTGATPDPLALEPEVGWVGDDEFGVITWGSSSCPAVAGELQVDSASELRIEFGPSPHDPCTADLAATTHIFRLPAAVTDRPITVIVGFEDWDEEYLLPLS